MVAGDVVTENITIRWEGKNRAFFELFTTISPDDIGINVTYSESTFFLDPGTKILIKMIVNTSIPLVPGIYIITTNVRSEMEEPEPPVDPSNGKKDDESHWYPDDYEPGYEPDVPSTENITEDPEKPSDDNNTLYYKTYGEDNNFNKFSFPFLILGITLFVIMLLYLISRRKKKAEKPGETKK